MRIILFLNKKDNLQDLEVALKPLISHVEINILYLFNKLDFYSFPQMVIRLFSKILKAAKLVQMAYAWLPSPGNFPQF